LSWEFYVIESGSQGLKFQTAGGIESLFSSPIPSRPPIVKPDVEFDTFEHYKTLLVEKEHAICQSGY